MRSLLLLWGFLSLTAAEDTVFSGPQVGEKLISFEMLDVLGKAKLGTSLLVPSRIDRPQLLIFVHERSRPAFGLSNTVMRLAADLGPQKLAASMTYLSADPTEAAGWMNTVSRHFPEGIDVGVFSGGIEGPEAYGLNRNVAVTVLVANKNIVTANFALVQPSLEVDAPKIFKAIAEALGERNVPQVAAYQPEAMSGRRPSNAGRQDPNLRPLLVALINKTATVEQVEAAAANIERYAEEHPDARLQIGDIARRIIAADKLSNYGTPECQDYLTQWSKDFSHSNKPSGTSPAKNDLMKAQIQP